MDGTLIDQTAPIIRCYSDVVVGLGYEEPDPERIRRSLGGPMASTMKLFVKPEHMEQACVDFRQRFPEMMYDGLVILPGALELIAFFADKGIPQAIFTNKHGDTARAVSAYCGFDAHIPVCIGNKDTDWAKPDSALTLHVLQQIESSTGGSILIGDSPTDAKTAENAGIDFYGVSTGAHSVEELQAAGAEIAVECLVELRECFTI